MTGERLPSPAEGVVFRKLQGEVVLVHLGTDEIYALNETGARFWELLAAGSDRETIRRSLSEEFDVQPHALDDEIDRLLAELLRSGLIS